MLILIFAEENAFMTWITTPPGSMLFILLMSIMVSLISVGLTKLLTDTDELNRKQVQIKAHQEQKQKIIKMAEVDEPKYRKMRKRWERKDIMLKKTQQSMALQKLKPTCITMLPMIIIFSFIRGLFEAAPVAMSPMNAWDVPLLGGMVQAFTATAEDWTAAVYGRIVVISIEMGWINFTAWYFICSLGTNTLLQRLLKIQTQASGGMETMFKSQKDSATSFPDI